MKSAEADRPTRFVVLFEGRSGSTYFIESLASHPRICAKKELLAAIKKSVEAGKSEPLAQLEALQSLYFLDDAAAYDAIGFKTKLKDILDPEALIALIQNNDIHVILLQRRNRIKLLVSLLNAMRLNDATGDWNLYDESNRQGTLRCDVDEFREWLDNMEQSNRELNDFVKQLKMPTLSLFYEDILTNPTSTFRRTCDFLKVGYQPLQGDCMKNTSDDLRDVLENFDELHAAFSQSPYEKMFTEVLAPRT